MVTMIKLISYSTRNITSQYYNQSYSNTEAKGSLNSEQAFYLSI
jgi:hypothetical protein